MIELSSRVAAAARFPAVRPRRGAGSLGQRPAPAPLTRSHGAWGARRGPDPLPLAGGLRGLPSWWPRRSGCSAAGRVPVGRERPARPLLLQVPQLADHAHLRLLPALPGRGTAARPGVALALRTVAWGARGACLPASAPKLLAGLGRQIPLSFGVNFTIEVVEPSFPAASLLPKGKTNVQHLSPTLLFPAENARRFLWVERAALQIPRVGVCIC